MQLILHLTPIICFLAINAEEMSIRNTIQFGWGASDEGMGVNAKYMHKVGPMYFGGEIKLEEAFELFGSSNVNEGATSFRIPVGVMHVGTYYFIGAESGLGVSKFTRKGALIESSCQGLFTCHSEYVPLYKYGAGVTVEANAGLRVQYFGIGVSSGFELNSYRSSPYFHLKFWIGY